MVHVNLEQMLALATLVHRRAYRQAHDKALKMGSFVEKTDPVVAYVKDGTRYAFYPDNTVKKDGVRIHTIDLGLTFIPVIPKWFGDDIDPLWEDMYIKDVHNWMDMDSISQVNVVEAVWHIIGG